MRQFKTKCNKDYDVQLYFQWKIPGSDLDQESNQFVTSKYLVIGIAVTVVLW